ncbi:unnamed protein product, partial [Arctogadus glacialis]
PRPSNAKGSAAQLCSSIKSLTAAEARRIINNDSIKNKRLLFWGTKQLLLRKESSKCLFESCGEEQVQLSGPSHGGLRDRPPRITSK